MKIDGPKTELEKIGDILGFGALLPFLAAITVLIALPEWFREDSIWYTWSLVTIAQVGLPALFVSYIAQLLGCREQLIREQLQQEALKPPPLKSEI